MTRYVNLFVKAKDEGDVSHVSHTYVSLGDAAVFTVFR